MRQTHTAPGLHSRYKSRAQRQPPTSVAHPQRHRVAQRQSHHPLRQQALPPRNRTSLHGARHPHGHHRQPHQNITQKTRQNHHRAPRRHIPQLPKTILAKRRLTPDLKPKPATWKNKNQDTGLSTMSRLMRRFLKISQPGSIKPYAEIRSTRK